ncbi:MULTISPECIES: Ig-like domain-containing protein [Methanoculleus]|uniref:Ig domain protein, group 2 domain protein n=2 Tax=Methanoculleus TaxID=45989 RepID=A3CUU3_METMJ|nr:MULTISPECIES: Ig-like domain-containing protein [Methanoculleus]ABN57143.1 Ig domain protein, group 2 domain protein [Methanoculleus marisnigri JR1]UYU18560.1 Ig-like domain-containing protein [Methanoculleus submarinus]
MTKHTYLALLCAVVIIGLLTSPVMAVEAASGEEIYRPFVNAQERPDIDGDMIVWEDDRNGNKDIYFGTVDEFRNKPPLTTTRVGERITSDDASQEKPSISGDYIVWQDDRNGNWDIYLYQRSTGEETQLTTDTGDQWLPIVRGNYVAWYDDSSGDTKIVLYDIAAGAVKATIDADAKTTIPDGATGVKPALSEKYVAWIEKADERAWYYDIADETKMQVSGTGLRHSWPSLYGSQIAWECYLNRSGIQDPEIYLMDLDNPSGGEQQITNAPNYQVSPALSENIIAWEDMQDGPRGIYMYDLATGGEEMSVFAPEDIYDEQLYPAASGNTIVWQRGTGINSNIYIFIYGSESSEPVVTTITVTPTTPTLAVDETEAFTATVLDQDGVTMTGIDVEWASSNETVGTIDADGVFTALAEGTADVTATAEGVTGEATVTVNGEEPTDPAATRIEITPTTATLAINGTVEFSAIVFDQFDEEMSEVAVEWASSDETVGTVSTEGVFTAHAEGTADVTATAGNATETATVTVSAEELVIDRIEVTSTTATLAIGETEAFTATVRDQFGSAMTGIDVEWASSNETVGTIDADGVFTALAEGTADVTATAENVTGEATVTVTAGATGDPTATRIEITPLTTAATVNGTVNFSATVYDQFDAELPEAEIEWASSNETIGTIDANGTFTALAAGITAVTATAGNASASALVTVNEEEPAEPVLESIRITPPEATLAIGDTQLFIVTARDEDGAVMTDVEIAWTSSDETVGTIDANGTFTALAEGTADVTATAENVTATATITVNDEEPALASIAVAPSAITLAENDTATFTATAFDQFGTSMTDVEINWTGSDETVGTIDADGVFSAVADGTTTITAAAGNITGTAAVTVTTSTSGVAVSPSAIILDLGDEWQFTATVYDLQDNASDPTVNWTSSDEAVGTIDADGLFSALTEGTATITATADNETGTATVTVESSQVATRIEIEPPTATILPEETQAFTATVFDQRDNEMDWIRVTWSSSNPEVGTIDRAGLFGAFAEGSTDVTASVGDVAETAAVTVSATVAPEPTPGSGGSGGSSGGGDSTPSFSAGIRENLRSGETFTFSDISVTSVSSVNVTAASTIPKMMLTVKKAKASSAAEPPAGDVYEYIEITPQWVSQNQIGNATVFFSVPANWLESHNATAEDVVLMRYVNGIWESLETEVIGEENSKYNFRATTPGFSIFAIIASPVSVIASAEELNITAEVTGTPEVTGNVTTEPTTVPATTPTAPLVYAPLLAPLAFLLWARKRR